MLRGFLLACCLLLAPTASRGCDLALVLAVDVSGSVDPGEYALQRDGLAAALRDGLVAEALVRARAEVAVLQWTGSSRQRLTIPWTSIHSDADVTALAARVESDLRIWRNFSTAIGEALGFALPLFQMRPDCRRKVIDVSGDGISNEGVPPREVHAALAAAGVTVNGLVIAGAQEDVTGHYYENVIRGPGAFVLTADGFADYPDRIRQKLLREVTKPTASLH